VAQDCLTRLCLIEVGKLLGRFGFWFAPTFGGIPLLTRLYVVHISVLPALFTLAVAVHLLLVKRLKMAPSPFRKGPEPEPTRPFTHHLGELAALGLVLIGVLTVLAVLLPPGHGPAPVEGLEVTKPPWPLLWVYPVEDWVGVAGILWATLAIFAALLLVPVLDRSPRGPPRSAPCGRAHAGEPPRWTPRKPSPGGSAALNGAARPGAAKAEKCPTRPGSNYPYFGERGTIPRSRAKRVRSALRREPVLLRIRSKWEWTVRTLSWSSSAMSWSVSPPATSSRISRSRSVM
jgi:hypothetical protein